MDLQGLVALKIVLAQAAQHLSEEAVTTQKIYVIFNRSAFDGPLHFVEVEDADGNSLSPEQTGAGWSQPTVQRWVLGPFAKVEPTSP